VVCLFFTSQAFVARAQSGGTSLEKLRARAETQHEIVMLLFGKKEFSKAAEEAAKIFEMNWPAEQEPILLKELLFFSRYLSRQGQAAIGLGLVERSEKCFKTNSSRLDICKEKGYLYKVTNQPEKSLECFREAQRLLRAPQ
jgi:tetratricopeptide (TPR) repeat protein